MKPAVVGAGSTYTPDAVLQRSRALPARPLTGQQRQAEQLTDLLLETNSRYLAWA
jgi:alpha-galactosidase/6-phospho-beta-glucosidase family protein